MFSMTFSSSTIKEKESCHKMKTFSKFLFLQVKLIKNFRLTSSICKFEFNFLCHAAYRIKNNF